MVSFRDPHTDDKGEVFGGSNVFVPRFRQRTEFDYRTTAVSPCVVVCGVLMPVHLHANVRSFVNIPSLAFRIVTGETRQVHGLREEYFGGVTAVPRDPAGELLMPCTRHDEDRPRFLTRPFEKPVGFEVLSGHFDIFCTAGAKILQHRRARGGELATPPHSTGTLVAPHATVKPQHFTQSHR